MSRFDHIADYYARTCLAWETARREAEAARAEAYAAACAYWAAQGATIHGGPGTSGGVAASEAPGAVQEAAAASRRGFMTASRYTYARDSGDPGARAGYAPEWLAETAKGPKR